VLNYPRAHRSGSPIDLVEYESSNFPSTLEEITEEKKRFQLSSTSDEYKSIAFRFTNAMQEQCKQIIQIERIQNISSYKQYATSWIDFKRRLKKYTERRLYHGCPESSANLIINGFFNRIYAGANGKSVNRFF
jgi:hypothetical protein